MGRTRTGLAGRGRLRGALVGLTAGTLLAGGVPQASAATPDAVQPLVVDRVLVAGGPGNQFVPELSGSLLAYADASAGESVIRYVDLSDGSAGSVPVAAARDTLPDVSGDTIVFRRIPSDGSGARIMVFDVGAPELGAREIAPDPGARRSFPAVGGTTVAFSQYPGSLANYSDMCVADLADIAAPAVCLTSDGTTTGNDQAAVSADGGTVVWEKCSTSATPDCEIHLARRASDGSWSSPQQLTDDAYYNSGADIDGGVVTYNAAEYPVVGEQEAIIRWISLADGSRGELDLSALDMPFAAYPSVSGGVITFQVGQLASEDSDLYAYRLATGALYRLTQTPGVFEWHNAVSVSPDGLLRVAWFEDDGTDAFFSNDVHALSAQLPPVVSGPQYQACRLYDASKAYRLGSTVPLKVRLCDADGTDLSSAERSLTVTGLVRLDGTASATLAESSGNGTPDDAFRYDPALPGYVYNLSTKKLSQGTWELRFVVNGGSTVLRLPFDVR